MERSQQDKEPMSYDDDKIEEIKKQLIAEGWEPPPGPDADNIYELKEQLIAEGWRRPPPELSTWAQARLVVPPGSMEDLGPLGYEGKRQPPQEEFGFLSLVVLLGFLAFMFWVARGFYLFFGGLAESSFIVF
jgi:hypothetical protein